MQKLSYGRAGLVVVISVSAGLSVLTSTWLSCPVVNAKPLSGGISYYNAEDYKRAMPIFERVLARDPNNEQARYYLALCYQREQQTAKANEHFEWLGLHARDAKIRALALRVLKTVKRMPTVSQKAVVPRPNKQYAAGVISTAETMLSISVPTAEKAVLPQVVQDITPPGTVAPGVDKGAGNRQELCKVIYFYKEQDPLCARFDKEFGAAQERLKGRLVFEKLKMDDPANSALLKKYGVSSVPYLVYLDGNGALIRTDGTNTFISQSDKLALPM